MPDHPYLEFATRYNDPSQHYLNAEVALFRLEGLQEDLDMIKSLLEKEWPHENRYAPWFGAEAISYYAVGFVTCLEWHARSRIVDLHTHLPKSITVQDVKRTMTDNLIVQMVGKNASVAQLVGAALKINSLEQYLSVFTRLFKELGFKFKPVDWLLGRADGATVCWMSEAQLQDITRIFEFRHNLVHEIGVSVVGHPNIRDSLIPDEAVETGRLFKALIAGLEDAITRFAPWTFPNVLTAEGTLVERHTQLEAELAQLTSQAEKAISETEWQFDGTYEAWQIAREEFASYMAAEDKFIERGEMLHWRYFDARTPLRARMLDFRVGFLKELLSHLDVEADDNLNTKESANAAND